MAKLIIEIPDAAVERVENAFAAAYLYPEHVAGKPNPLTNAEFLKAHLREYVCGVVCAHEVRAMSAEAEAVALAAAEKIKADFAL